MKKKLTVIRNNQRISGAEVQIEGANQVYNTNAKGEVEVEFPSGISSLRISHENVWTEHSVDLAEDSGPLWFDISQARTTGEFLRQNTLNLGDRFVYHTVLGRGGMGTVVKAEDRVLRRPVAIKILAEELRDNIEAQDIFLSEGRSLAALSHPNLVSVFDVVSVNDRAMMVLEYIDGKSLEQELQDKINIGVTNAVQYGIQLGRALAYLHTHNIVHRDIKPANLMLLPDGTLKIIDFGLARSMEHLRVKTTQVRGSPAYMAPEQIRGEEVTEATDIYQAGVTLFEIVTGVLPFQVKPNSIAHFENEVPRPSDRIGGIHPALDNLIYQCLQKEPEARPASAEVFTETLRKINRSLTSPADLGEIDSMEMERAPQKSGVNKKLAFVALLSLLLIGGAGFALYTVANPDEGAEDTLAAAAENADPVQDTPPTPDPEPAEVEPQVEEQPTDFVAANAASNQVAIALTASRAAGDVLGSAPDSAAAARPDARPAPKPKVVKRAAPAERVKAAPAKPKPSTQPKEKPAEASKPDEQEAAARAIASTKPAPEEATPKEEQAAKVEKIEEPKVAPKPEPAVTPKPKPKTVKKKKPARKKVSTKKKPKKKQDKPVPVPMSF